MPTTADNGEYPHPTAVELGAEIRHGCIVYTGGGYSWSTCSCGWRSNRYVGPAGASYAWANHVLDHAEAIKQKAHNDLARNPLAPA